MNLKRLTNLLIISVATTLVSSSEDFAFSAPNEPEITSNNTIGKAKSRRDKLRGLRKSRRAPAVNEESEEQPATKTASAKSTKSESKSATRLSHKTFNLRTNALVIAMYELVNADLDIATGPAWTAGPTFFYRSISADPIKLTLMSTGARINYSLNKKRFTKGLLLSLQSTYLRFTINSTSTDSLGTVTETTVSSGAVGAGGMLTYQLPFRNGFNIFGGLGAIYYKNLANTDSNDPFGIGPTEASKQLAAALFGVHFSYELGLGFIF